MRGVATSPSAHYVLTNLVDAVLQGDCCIGWGTRYEYLMARDYTFVQFLITIVEIIVIT